VLRQKEVKRMNMVAKAGVGQSQIHVRKTA
jgi:hypothetical protein